VRIIKWIWLLLTFSYTIQYFHWAAMEVSYALSLSGAPNVPHDWLFLAFMGAGIAGGEQVGKYFNELMKRAPDRS
jgi:hypothetical protein